MVGNVDSMLAEVVGVCWLRMGFSGWKLGSENLSPGRLGNSGRGS